MSDKHKIQLPIPKRGDVNDQGEIGTYLALLGGLEASSDVG